MLKTLGFIGVLLALMIAVQPQFFINLFGFGGNKTTFKAELSDEGENSPTDTDATAQNGDKNGQKLLVSGDTDLSPVQGTAEYAKGYSKKDFGKAYEAPESDDPNAPKDKTEVEGVWKTLLKLTYNIKYDERLDDMAYVPIFSAEIKALEGKEIELKGYILPHDITKMDKSGNNQGNMFMFSAFPAQSCFFCGAAGPESVVEVSPKKPIPYSKSAVKIKGKLQLNGTDFLRMAYILKDARLSE